jgi:multidrug efflux pump subunit AcrA (membrane-fusion protein)
VVTGKATKALVLPIEAVAGSQGKGKVDVVDDGRTRKTVDVTLGLTDGRFIEIKTGLKGGETIAVPGPDLPDAPPAAGDPNANPSGPTG